MHVISSISMESYISEITRTRLYLIVESVYHQITYLIRKYKGYKIYISYN